MDYRKFVVEPGAKVRLSKIDASYTGKHAERPRPTDPKIKARIADLGATVLGGSPAEFGKLIANETEKWGKVIRAAGIKAE
jgi:hypothetical protein